VSVDVIVSAAPAAEERVAEYVQHCQEELRESAEFYAADKLHVIYFHS